MDRLSINWCVSLLHPKVHRPTHKVLHAPTPLHGSQAPDPFLCRFVLPWSPLWHTCFPIGLYASWQSDEPYPGVVMLACLHLIRLAFFFPWAAPTPLFDAANHLYRQLSILVGFFSFLPIMGHFNSPPDWVCMVVNLVRHLYRGWLTSLNLKQVIEVFKFPWMKEICYD